MSKATAVVIVLAGIAGGVALGVLLRPGDHSVVQNGTTGNVGGEVASDAVDGPGGSGRAGISVGDGVVEAVSTNRDDAKFGGGGSDPDGEIGSDREFVKIGRQIIIPVVNEGETRALMLFDLALDVPSSMTERTYAAEPRLRDAFLRELFELSYTGAFSGTYTDERIVEEMRAKLRRAARRLLGDSVAEVLILDIMRQEL